MREGRARGLHLWPRSIIGWAGGVPLPLYPSDRIGYFGNLHMISLDRYNVTNRKPAFVLVMQRLRDFDSFCLVVIAPQDWRGFEARRN